MKRSLIIAACALLAACTSAFAVAPVTYNSDLTGGLGTIHLSATATYSEVDALWTYTYVANLADMTATYVTGLTLGNVGKLEFLSASNFDNTNTQRLPNPVYDYVNPTQSIFWQGGTPNYVLYKTQGPATFSFKSKYAPSDPTQDVTIYRGATKSAGKTFTIIPEPGTFAGLALCGASAVGSFLMRRRSR